ncbi:MAG: 3-dehydroquinate synthase [Oceanipulchritudo sp.]
MILETLDVSLGERSYPIHIGRCLEERLEEQVQADLAVGHRLVVITDSNTAAAQRTFMRKAFRSLPVLVLPAGEPTKSFKHLERCCNFLAETRLDRGGRVFALGGGVVGDLAGFAAASYFRGIGFYQIPTTLLAMVDSSVGGKTGINLQAGKNLVGAFHQPLVVYADLDTLVTLPEREFNAGMAEIIKHGLLADGDLFRQLEAGPRLHASSNELAGVVGRNCLIKAGVVAADEREESRLGGRALLNLGHTFGHAIEAVSGYGTYLHGEAVAIGLVMAARLSAQLGKVDANLPGRVEALLEAYDLPVSLKKPLGVEALLTAARKDKKARSGRMRYILLEEAGKAVVAEGIHETRVAGLWEQVGAVRR